jgi:3-methylcrotonyl-CoA carboxylase alpha subunit
MIAKLIVWGADRAQALARLAQALGQFQVVGLSTNIAFLKRLVEGQAFAGAELDTGLIERHHDSLFPPLKAAPLGALALAAVALMEGERQPGSADPWAGASGWRMNGAWLRRLAFIDDYISQTPEKTYSLALRYHADRWNVQIDGIDVDLSLSSRKDEQLTISLGGTAIRGSVVRDGDVFHVFTGGRHYALTYDDPMAHAGEQEHGHGALTAPMPGKGVAVMATPGQQVKKGDPLVIMEAMKMEHTIAAPSDGRVEQVLYQVGDQVADGAPLLEFEAA